MVFLSYEDFLYRFNLFISYNSIHIFFLFVELLSRIFWILKMYWKMFIICPHNLLMSLQSLVLFSFFCVCVGHLYFASPPFYKVSSFTQISYNQFLVQLISNYYVFHLALSLSVNRSKYFPHHHQQYNHVSFEYFNSKMSKKDNLNFTWQMIRAHYVKS